MIHIMGDLRSTTQVMERREQELRDKQEQLIQAGKLATLGELTTGVAHELNNPLNNIGLYVGNAIDRIHMGELSTRERPRATSRRRWSRCGRRRRSSRTCARSVARRRSRLEPVDVDEVIERALSLMQEQLRLREIEVDRRPRRDALVVHGQPDPAGAGVHQPAHERARRDRRGRGAKKIRIVVAARARADRRSSSTTPGPASRRSSGSASSSRSSRRRRSAPAPASVSRSVRHRQGARRPSRPTDAGGGATFRSKCRSNSDAAEEMLR